MAMNTDRSPFHLAIPVHELGAAREFYGELIGCVEGRSSELWVDFNFYGHQLVCHQVSTAIEGRAVPAGSSNEVDGDVVPVPHFGVVLPWSDWEELAARLQQNGVAFMLDPGVRFTGQSGEQATMFLADPSGNVLEFKAMRKPENLFK
jgi:extradiol dioxygenase family protein